MPPFPLTDRHIPWWVLTASLATIAGALFFQFVMGLEPCSLCLQQRVPYYAAMPLALVAGIAGRQTDGPVLPALMGALVLIFAVSAGLGVYHAGVEYHWWQGPAGCSGGAGFAGSVADFRARLDGARPVRCDEVPWSFLGLSLAGYNVLISLALMGLSAVPPIRAARGGRQ